MDRLCQLVFEPFDKDQYPLLLKQFTGLRQTGFVAEYVEEFERLAHGLLLYNPAYDDTYFVTEFVNGLKEEIRSVIALHRPSDVVSASALACLQEEELSKGRLRSVGRDWQKPAVRQSTDRPRSTESDKVKFLSGRQESEDKLMSLRDHRRKHGLCFKCGEKWSNTHTCPAKVSLHVIEELLDALTPVEVSVELPEEEFSEDIISVVTSEYGNVQKRRRTLKLCGCIGKQEILILVDLGTVATFISDSLVDRLQLDTVATEPTKFMAADGSPMICSFRVPNLQWSTQNHSFISDTGVIPLKCFDMVLGEDWLEECSPMWVDSAKKILRFTSKGQRITLHGIKSLVSSCTTICPIQLQGMFRRGAIDKCLHFKQSEHELQSLEMTPDFCSIVVPNQLQRPDVVQVLFGQYADIFQEPHELPPQRPFDHHIAMLPGASPINVRPYRYSPAQKDEIEKQLTQMLFDGIIMPSVSPFASPVLLVRKKDNTWCFCVDYRHLNVVTVKNKHPMPIVDELINELAGATWFSKLDFRAGYHQVRIASGDTHKTAFKTYDGLYEFLVMPFGLTNAPATFQSLMNVIFRHLLRKGVLVFMDDILIYSATLDDHIRLLREVFEIIRTNHFVVQMLFCSTGSGISRSYHFLSGCCY